MHAAKQLVAALALAGMSAGSFAATTYTTSTSFLSLLAPGAYTESFSNLSSPSGTAAANFSTGGFAYSASASQGLYLEGGFLGTNQINDALTVTFTSGNVKAFGANFYLTDFSDQFQSVQLTVTLSDGTTTTFTPTALGDSFRGYTSTVAIASVTITAPGQSLYAGLDNLTVGTVSAVPEPASLVLMGVGVLGLLARSRRKAA